MQSPKYIDLHSDSSYDRKVEGHMQPPRREKCARVYTTIYTQLDYMLTMVSSAKRNPLEWEYCPADGY